VARVTPVYEDHVGMQDPDDKRVRRIILYAFPRMTFRSGSTIRRASRTR